LDVGCGMGRFAEVVTRWGARVVGIDLSVAAKVAVKNLADREFVGFQADVFALPFAPETFDCIYSMGVLHHTPDCEKAVKVLPQYLKTRRHPRGLALQRLQQVVIASATSTARLRTEFRPAFSIISFAWPCLFFMA